MMRDKDKPFIWIKSASGIKISPRNALGWKLMGWWMAAMLVLAGLFILAMSGHPRSTTAIAYTVAFLIATTVWAIAMIRWMMARSEVINLDELIALKRQQDEARQRSRR